MIREKRREMGKRKKRGGGKDRRDRRAVTEVRRGDMKQKKNRKERTERMTKGELENVRW
jgi:hypothetical protein